MIPSILVSVDSSFHNTSNIDGLYCCSPGTTPLVQAIRQGKNEVLRVFLEVGVNASQANKIQGCTLWQGASHKQHLIYPLQAAVDVKNVDAIQLLLSHGASLNQCNEGLQGLFNLAIQQNCDNLMKLVFMMGKEMEAGNEFLLNMPRGIDLTGPLVTAVQLRNTNMAQLLLELGADVNRQSGGLLPVVVAANNEDVDMCTMLLSNGATLGATTGHLASTQTPLSIAILTGLEKAVGKLIQMGCDVNILTDVTHTSNGRNHANGPKRGCSLLHLAVMKNSLPIAKKLIEAGCPLNHEDGTGNTPLHVVCTVKGGEEHALTKLFLQLADTETRTAGEIVNINARNDSGQTPLMVAIVNRNFNTALLILKAGPQLQLFDKQHWTALHYAVQQANDEVVLALLRAGCEVDAPLSKGEPVNCSALHLAAEKTDPTFVDILLEFNANAHLTTKLKETVLHRAVQGDSEEVIERFLEMGLDVDKCNASGSTPLMLAAQYGKAAICQLLCNNRANLNFCNRQHETPLMLSVYLGYDNTAKVLIGQGASLMELQKRYGKDTENFCEVCCYGDQTFRTPY